MTPGLILMSSAPTTWRRPRQEIQQRIGNMTLNEAQECLEGHDVPCAPVRTAEQVMNDQHFWDRGSLVPMNHGAMNEPVAGAVGAGFPVRFSGGELPPLPARRPWGCTTTKSCPGFWASAIPNWMS